MQNKQRGSIGVWVALMVILLLIAGGAFWFYSHNTTTQEVTTNTTTNQPNVKVTDLSQGVPENQKTAVLVEHSDSSFEKFLLPNAMVDNYIKQLPPGDRFVSKTPLGK